MAGSNGKKSKQSRRDERLARTLAGAISDVLVPE